VEKRLSEIVNRRAEQQFSSNEDLLQSAASDIVRQAFRQLKRPCFVEVSGLDIAGVGFLSALEFAQQDV
jgi:hypothetical protein